MEFHPAKCEIIRFSRKRNRTTLPPYRLHNQIIPVTKTIKYLEVHIQDDLKWRTHTDYVTNKASTTLGFVRRTVPPQSTQLRCRAYKQLVRSVLEYALCLPKTRATQIEAVERRSGRMVFNIPRISTASTTGMLDRLDLEPLEDRRQ